MVEPYDRPKLHLGKRAALPGDSRSLTVPKKSEVSHVVKRSNSRTRGASIGSGENYKSHALGIQVSSGLDHQIPQGLYGDGLFLMLYFLNWFW